VRFGGAGDTQKRCPTAQHAPIETYQSIIADWSQYATPEKYTNSVAFTGLYAVACSRGLISSSGESAGNSDLNIDVLKFKAEDVANSAALAANARESRAGRIVWWFHFCLDKVNLNQHEEVSQG
jgi:hypothetical protein